MIAGTAYLEGTVRTFSETARRRVRERVHETVAGVCAGAGARGEVKYDEGYPPTVTDERVAETVMGVAREVLGADHVHVAAPLMVGEDFSYFLQSVPGAYLLLGSAGDDPRTCLPGHNPVGTSRSSFGREWAKR